MYLKWRKSSRNPSRPSQPTSHAGSQPREDEDEDEARADGPSPSSKGRNDSSSRPATRNHGNNDKEDTTGDGVEGGGPTW